MTMYWALGGQNSTENLIIFLWAVRKYVTYAIHMNTYSFIIHRIWISTFEQAMARCSTMAMFLIPSFRTVPHWIAYFPPRYAVISRTFHITCVTLKWLLKQSKPLSSVYHSNMHMTWGMNGEIHLLNDYNLIQSGIWSGFPHYDFPANFCHSKHVLQRKRERVRCIVPLRVVGVLCTAEGCRWGSNF